MSNSEKGSWAGIAKIININSHLSFTQQICKNDILYKALKNTFLIDSPRTNTGPCNFSGMSTFKRGLANCSAKYPSQCLYKLRLQSTLYHRLLCGLQASGYRWQCKVGSCRWIPAVIPPLGETGLEYVVPPGGAPGSTLNRIHTALSMCARGPWTGNYTTCFNPL